MEKATNRKLKQAVVKMAEKSIMKIADFYAGMPCQGRIYEPKMPEKLKK